MQDVLGISLGLNPTLLEVEGGLSPFGMESNCGTSAFAVVRGARSPPAGGRWNRTGTSALSGDSQPTLEPKGTAALAPELPAPDSKDA